MTVAVSVEAPFLAPTAKKKNRIVQARYGVSMRFDVTPAIASSVTRLSPRKGPMTQSDVCRAALHLYCLANDPQYARELQDN
jgi:hypothetical protein